MTVDGTVEEKDGTTMSSSKTVTSETSCGTTVTTTTTHISKVSSTFFFLFISLCSVYFIYSPLNYDFFCSQQVVKSGSSETRVEKRIVINADSDIDQDKVQTLCTRNFLPMTQNSKGIVHFGNTLAIINIIIRLLAKSLIISVN